MMSFPWRAAFGSLFTPILWLCVSASAFEASAAGRARPCDVSPLAVFNSAVAICREGSAHARARVADLMQVPKSRRDAAWHLEVAELMKCTGSAAAEDYYERALATAPDEPGYELFYADYLRNFRGAGRPLFPDAERHYFAGLEKSRALPRLDHGACTWDEEVASRLDRGIVALYQEDGLPLFSWRATPAADGSLRRPLLFLSTSVRFARASEDLDRTSDVRDYASEAAFAQSGLRRQSPLTTDQLRDLIRIREPFETGVRLRFRYKTLPALDGFYLHRSTADAQVTDFFQPSSFNALHLDEYGLSAEKPFAAGRAFDAVVAAGYRQSRRKGLVEFLPEMVEDVDQLEARGAMARYVGPDKVIARFAFARQDIAPRLPTLPSRDRTLASATVMYQVFRPIGSRPSPFSRRFETRGIDLYAGVLHDREGFPGAIAAEDVLVRRRDYFAGIAAHGLGRFDVTVQPTVFTSQVNSDPSQDNSQYRTNVSVLYRIVDEEAQPRIPVTGAGLHLALLHLVVLVRHDVARTGLDAFGNVKAGLELHAKFFSAGHRRTTFLVSVAYGHQRFSVLDRSLNLFGVGVSIGR